MNATGPNCLGYLSTKNTPGELLVRKIDRECKEPSALPFKQALPGASPGAVATFSVVQRRHRSGS